MAFLMSDKNPCVECKGACCKYVSLEIDCPGDLEDFENIRWYVIHKGVRVYVEEDGSWNLEFSTPCKYLSGEGNCKIHENSGEVGLKRPSICKNFSIEECPFYNDYKEIYSFNCAEEVDEYIEKIFKNGLHVIPEQDEED